MWRGRLRGHGYPPALRWSCPLRCALKKLNFSVFSRKGLCINFYVVQMCSQFDCCCSVPFFSCVTFGIYLKLVLLSVWIVIINCQCRASARVPNRAGSAARPCHSLRVFITSFCNLTCKPDYYIAFPYLPNAQHCYLVHPPPIKLS